MKKPRKQAVIILLVVLCIQSIYSVSLSDIKGKEANFKFNKNNAVLLHKFVQPSDFQTAADKLDIRTQTKGSVKETEWYVEDGGETQCCTGEPITFEDEKFIVTIGLYVDQISSLDVDGSNFFLRGYLWIIWKSCYALPDGEPFNPFLTIEAQNVAQQWATTLTPQSTSPECFSTDGIEHSYMLFGLNMNIGQLFF